MKRVPSPLECEARHHRKGQCRVGKLLRSMRPLARLLVYL
jgi:hypothetical protein